MLELPTVIDSRIEEYLSEELFTFLPAVLTDVSRLTSHQEVSAKPIVNRSYTDGTVKEYPILEQIPIVFPTGGGGTITFPMAVGDSVLLLFSKVSLDEWGITPLSQEAITPKSSRLFDLADVVAICGLSNSVGNVSPSATDVEIKFNQASIRIEPNNNIIISTPADITSFSNMNTTNCTTAIVNADSVTTNCIDSILNTTTATVNATSVLVVATTIDITATTTTITSAVNIIGALSVTGTSTLMGAVGMGGGGVITGGVGITGGITGDSIIIAGKDIGPAHVHGGIFPGSGSTAPVT